MSKLKELIDRLCPDGVEFKPLGELGVFFGGLTGKSKDDFKDGNAKFITYVNIYSNPALNIDVNDFVKVDEKEKQNRIQKGDILFTGSSETPNECGFTSVVTCEISEPIYLNSFCFGLRLSNPALFNLDFLKHILRSEELRKQIGKTASGVTRFNVSKARLSKVVLPIPPLEVQNEIAKILDRFTDYAAELQARKEQYEYYRNLLLTFNPAACGCGTDGEQEIKSTAQRAITPPRWLNNVNIIWKPMGEIGTFTRGNGLQKKDFTNSGVGCIHYGQIYTHYGTFATETKSFVSPAFASKLRKAKYGDLIIATTSENVEDVGKALAWLGSEEIAISGDSYIFSHNQNPKFIAYLMQTHRFLRFKRMNVSGTKVTRISGESLEKYLIPIPPIVLQEKIVDILDRFETLVNDLTQGLPAEIAAVKERYEYYRDRLLTFQQA